MHYNLLYYGETTTSCTVNNNNVNDKDKYLKTIIDFVQPDIFTVNEMGCNPIYARRIKENTLNTNGNKYEVTNLQRNTGQGICNMLFYNTEKIKVVNQEEITQGDNGASIVRVIDLYEINFISTNLKPDHDQVDTPSTHILTMHLKASTGTANQAQREAAAGGVMKYLEANKQPGNFILTGDLNIYRSSEGAFKNFTNWTASSYNFQDPINRVGSWNSNSSFADVHTQSTHTSSGCYSGGGMDDRFDFILASQRIMDGGLSVKYIPGSYKALGQDGKRFDGRLNSPLNESAPAKVIDALYNMSDHLPVIMDVEVVFGQKPNSSGVKNQTDRIHIWVNSDREIVFQNNSNTSSNFDVRASSINGMETIILAKSTEGNHQFSTVDIPAGMYIINVINNTTGYISNYKIVLL